MQIRRHVEPVGFVVLHLGKIFRAFFDPNVASGAGAVAAAGVVEFDVVIERDIRKRLRLAMVQISQFAVFECDGLAFGQKCNFDSCFRWELPQLPLRLFFFLLTCCLSILKF